MRGVRRRRVTRASELAPTRAKAQPETPSVTEFSNSAKVNRAFGTVLPGGARRFR